MTQGLQLLAELAARQPLSPACDHFYFLRHGQTACNARRIFQAVDEPLSELGVQQAHHAASILAGEPVRSILTSGVVRALTTAHTVSAPHGCASATSARSSAARRRTSTGPASPRTAKRSPNSSTARAPRSSMR